MSARHCSVSFFLRVWTFETTRVQINVPKSYGGFFSLMIFPGGGLSALEVFCSIPGRKVNKYNICSFHFLSFRIHLHSWSFHVPFIFTLVSYPFSSMRKNGHAAILWCMSILNC